MKFLIDECLSHSYVRRLVSRGYPDSVHPINIGLRGQRDDQLVRRAIAEDRIIITSNATDYRELLARKTVHPGAIMILALEREKVWRLIEVALTFLEVQPDPAEFMINRVIEVSASEGILPYVLPVSD